MSRDAQPSTPGAIAAAGKEVWFESAGTRLFALENGSGLPIIALHGGLANHLAALRVVASLIPRFRVITPDLRASGKSVAAGPLSWDQLADDVAALMRHLDLPRAVVAGVSSGSGVALRFGLRYPQEAAGVALVMPVYGGDDEGLTEEQLATFRRMDALGSRAGAEGLEVLHPLYEGLPSPIRERALAIVDRFDAASVAATTRFLASGAQPFRTASDLHDLKAPTLLVPGNDSMHPARVAALHAAHIPSCTVAAKHSADLGAALGDFCERRASW